MRVVADDAIPWLSEALAAHPGLELVCLPSAGLASAMRSADAAIVRTVTRVDAALLAECPRLRFLGAASAGLDHLDVPALEARGIRWAHAPGCNADAVADWVVAAWHELEHAEPCSPRSERRVAVIGLGQTGARVAARLEALGHEIIAIDPIVASLPSAEWPAIADERAAAIRTRLAREGRLFAELNLHQHGPVHGVTLHVPLTTGGAHPTRSMLDLRRWHELGEPTWCINASRGEVFDVPALVERAWRGGRAPNLRLALDVWPHEPALPLDWLGDPRLVLATPHVAGYGRRAKWRATKIVSEALAEHFRLPHSAFEPHFDEAVIDVHVEEDGVVLSTTSDTRGRALHLTLPGRTSVAAITRDVLGMALGLRELDEGLRAASIPSDGAAHFLAQRRRAPHRAELAEVVVRLGGDASDDAAASLRAALAVRLSACGAVVERAPRELSRS